MAVKKSADVKDTCSAVCWAMATGRVFRWVPSSNPIWKRIEGHDIHPIYIGKAGFMRPRDWHNAGISKLDAKKAKAGAMGAINNVAGATKLQVNHEYLPEILDDVTKPWVNLLADPLWIEDTDGDLIVFAQTAHKDDFKRLKDSAKKRDVAKHYDVDGVQDIWNAVVMYAAEVDGELIFLDFSSLFLMSFYIVSRHDRSQNWWGMHATSMKATLEADTTEIEQICQTIESILMHTLFFANAVSNSKLTPVAPAHRKPRHQGYLPKCEYKVLGLKSQSGTSSPKLDVQLRRSPRLHLRRGHIRNYADRSIWIDPTLVGSHERGVIVRDYNDGRNS